MFKRIPWKTGWPDKLDSQSTRTAVFIGLGINIGTHSERLRLLNLALHKINCLSSTSVLAVSCLYETSPWGITDQPAFYNAVAAIRTNQYPFALLQALKSIEVQLGRKTRARWGPREIDLDILLSGDLQLKTPGLQIPHKHLTERPFALVPLLQINNLAKLPKGQLLRKV